MLRVSVNMDSRVAIAIELLSASPDAKLTDVAKALNLSKSRLRHLMKAEVGLPPGKYVKLLKMRQARELLASTFLQIKQVIHRVGINDTSHFVRDFKKAFGVTPTHYRRFLKGDRT